LFEHKWFRINNTTAEGDDGITNPFAYPTHQSMEWHVNKVVPTHWTQVNESSAWKEEPDQTD
jgi:hypothetical protein